LMTTREPPAELDPRFSSPEATPASWGPAERQLERAEIFWLATVRPDGRPHVTPLVSVWLDGAAYFATGPAERKAKNLEGNPNCVLTTGCDKLGEGFDLSVEGRAVRVTNRAKLERVAAVFTAKYPEPFHFKVREGGFDGGGEVALVFEL